MKYTKEPRTIYFFDAEPGMKLASDVLGPDGALISPKGTILDIDIIAKLSSRNVFEIDVYEIDTSVDDSVEDDLSNGNNYFLQESSYFEKVRQSQSFKEFKQKYDTSVNNLKQKLNDIVLKNQEIDVAALVGDVNTVMTNFPNRLQMFDMIHCLRDFDDLTYTHCVNVALVATIIGQWVHLPESDLQLLTTAGLLHDIGKVQIPPEILNKTGRLTPEEFAIMKTHTSKGYEAIKGKKVHDRVKEAVLLHHEKCNGTGYPLGFKSDKIPEITKIITVADIYDAMTADRVYRKALCPFDVIYMLEKESFTTLDPKYTLPFIKNVAASYIHNNVLLSDGREAEVILLNDRDLSRPTVRCGSEFIDLTKNPQLKIASIIN